MATPMRSFTLPHGVVRLELAHQAPGQATPHPTQRHQRRLAHGLDGAGEDPAHIE
jgi:hypothetical protein